MAPLLLLALSVSPVHAQDARGFVEVRGSYFVGADGTQWQLIERARPSFEAPITDRVLVAATVEAALAQGRDTQTELQRAIEDSDLGPLLDAFECEWPTHANETLGIDGRGDYLDVDRLYLDAYTKHVDVRVGRQAVNWGSAQFLNPTDPFPEVLLAEPWRPRRGVNAVRANVPIDMHDITAVIGASDDFTSFRAAGRARVNAVGTDFALVGAYRQDSDDGLVGLDIRGTLGVGFWLEGAIKLDGDPHEELAVGIDYSFPVLENLIVVGQYYRNGAGGDADPTARLSGGVQPPECAGVDTSEVFGEAAEPDPFAPLLTGTNYGLLAVNVGFTPDVSANVGWLQAFDDGTAMIIPSVTTRPAGWAEISLTAQVPVRTWGDGGELSPRDEDLRLTTPGPTGDITVDLSGLVPDATLTLWTRASF